jgi:hypothetical protein
VLIGGAIGVGAQVWLGDLRSLWAWVVMAVAFGFVVQPVSTLIHELGHAVAVVTLGRRRAMAVVGRGPWVTIRLGPVTVRFSPLPTRGVRIAGFCRYDAAGLSWATRGWISLAGPIATLIELLAVLGLSPLLWNRGALTRYLLAGAVVQLAMSLAANLSPRPAAAGGERAVITQRDGYTARAAFARHRARVPVPPAARAAAGISTGDDPVEGRRLEKSQGVGWQLPPAQEGWPPSLCSKDRPSLGRPASRRPATTDRHTPGTSRWGP